MISAELLVVATLACVIRMSSSYLAVIRLQRNYHDRNFELKARSSLEPIRNVESLKEKIKSEMALTGRGLTATSSKKELIDDLIRSLEEECKVLEPARSDMMAGTWVVDYTTAPPPSNGKLGPFVGIARQVIDLDCRTYVNYLSLPGDLDKEWLSAKLEANFQEWDGIPLDVITKQIHDDRLEDLDVIKSIPSSLNWFAALPFMIKGPQKTAKRVDYGAKCWKVTFDTLEIRVFGIPVIKKEFEKGTSRVWKMSYLDQNTRVVRAGRTGRSKDDVVFYMSRE